GISVVNTIVYRHSQTHRNEMGHAITATSVSVQSQLRGIQQFLTFQGSSPATAMHQAYALINGTLSQQARLWAYVDTFRYMALVCFACIPIVFLLKKAVGKGGVSAGH